MYNIRIACFSGFYVPVCSEPSYREYIYSTYTRVFFKIIQITCLTISGFKETVELDHFKYINSFIRFKQGNYLDPWITNRAGNPDIILRNADDFHVPAHNLASINRVYYMTFGSYPAVVPPPSNTLCIKQSTLH
jgi:hypothetical protein